MEAYENRRNGACTINILADSPYVCTEAGIRSGPIFRFRLGDVEAQVRLQLLLDLLRYRAEILGTLKQETVRGAFRQGNADVLSDGLPLEPLGPTSKGSTTLRGHCFVSLHQELAGCWPQGSRFHFKLIPWKSDRPCFWLYLVQKP